MGRFAVGERYKSARRQAEVIGVKDEGRFGHLKFDDGEVLCLGWMELHQHGMWSKVP
jgi:hypothetical protein